MAIRRVAIIFDNEARPETTGGYCFASLQKMVDTVHVLPREVDKLTPADFDLFIRIDDGLDYVIPAHLRPLVWWAIDTHLDFDRCLMQASAATLTFAAQRSGTRLLQGQGVAAEWLPLACEPTVHKRHDVERQLDFAFVGNIFPGPRAELLALLCSHYPNHFVGCLYFDNMARKYSEARTVFNRSVRDDLNMRVFEGLACGSLLLTNDLPGSGQDELFKDGVHLASYRSAEELLDKIAFYLRRPEIRERVEEAGRRTASDEHTYRIRMERILLAAQSLPQTKPTSSTANMPNGPAYDPSYFEFDRPEILGKIPLTARDVLDIGCGAGRLGAALKKRQTARVVGVEIDPRPAAIAREDLDQVVVGDADSENVKFSECSFDAIVCGDVLEHLRDPLEFLRRARAWLRLSGLLVASIPNVRHHSVIRSLLAGDWTYEPAGLLDRTHLRFFTRREIEKLFFRSGFSAPILTVLPGPGHVEWVQAGRPGAVRVGGLGIGPLDPTEAEEFYTYQWLATANPVSAPDWGLTSIVIPVFNQLAFTRQCIDSLRMLTDEPYELIIVDNGSTDGTADYLRGLAESDSRIQVVSNTANRGFPAAANQGMIRATGRQLVLLNNDTILTTGWLHRLLVASQSGPTIGLVGPCSNNVSGEQQIEITYEDLAGLDGFAWERSKSHAGRTEDIDRLVGFCLLIRREVFQKIGLLDERFGLGNFEDDDYCRRARVAGFKVVIAKDAFVHHFGGQTFRQLGVDFVGLMRANQEQFERKWSAHDSAEKAISREKSVPPSLSSRSPMRVLVLAHVNLFRDRMGKGIYYRYRALARRPGVTLFGPGIAGYLPEMSIEDAVRVACGGIWPDTIIHGCDPWASGRPLVHGLERVSIVTAIEIYDSWAFEDRQFAFIRQQAFTLGLMAADGHHLRHYQSACPSTRFVWAPNAVDTDLFRDYQGAKEYDVILYGAIDPEVYPLRARIAALLTKQQEFRVRFIPHPGYYPPAEAQGSVVSGENLSMEINRSWIGIATSSIYRCLLEKYLEIAASNALIAGDMPESARSVFQGDFVELGLGDSDESILGKLRDVLADKDRLKAMTASVRKRVVEDFSTEAFADRVLNILADAVSARSHPSQLVSHNPPLTRLPENISLASRFTIRSDSTGGLLLESASYALSVCLIVRDNAKTIRACLESIRPWADELVVVDTGSNDDTPHIAAELGARVFHFPWCDDFSAARNESLRHARGQWVFWMDSDDTIDEVNGAALRKLATSQHPDSLLGFVVRVHCPGPAGVGEKELTVVDHVKLFRNLRDLCFEGRIHEQVLLAIRRLDGEVAWTDLFVVHSGYDHSPEGQKRKIQRDLRLLNLEIAERPNHPFTLFNLGMTYADIGQFEGASAYLEKSIAHSDPLDSHVRKAYALLAYCRLQLAQLDEALKVCRQGIDLFPDDVELRFRSGVILHQCGHLKEAATVFESVLAERGQRYFTSIDPGIAGFKARQNLAAVYTDLGDLARAENEWLQIVGEVPDYRPGWRGLGATLIARNELGTAEELAEQILTIEPLVCEGELLRGRVAAARGQLARARQSLQAAAALDASDPEPLRHLGNLLFDAGDDNSAEMVLLELTRRDPEDPSAFHNLGSVLLRSGRAREATTAFRVSLRLRPNSPETHLCLGYAAQAAGDRATAVSAWTQVLVLDPGNAEASAALRTV